MRDLEEVHPLSNGCRPGLANIKESEEARSYEYTTLPDDQSIRMLLLDPTENDETLKGTLEFANITSPGSYEPLSYVWGEKGLPGSENKILIRDRNSERTLEVTESLHGALRRLRLPGQVRRVWADQICINQADLVERGQQVQFMNRIYKNASHVLVWLGIDENDEAGSAFRLVQDLDQRFQDEAGCNQLHIQFAQDAGEQSKELEEQSGNKWRPLNHLTARPWFKRTWVAQEIGTKAQATLFWGSAEIDWTVLHRVCEKLTDYHHLRSKFNIATSDIKFFYQRFVEPDENSYHANRFNFMYELHRARGLKVSDHRDRVFAWLGHYAVGSSNGELAAIKADYKKTLEQVYIDVAKRALKCQTGDSALIALAAVQHESLPSLLATENHNDAGTKTINENELPSWVPDWRTYQSFILSEPINPHRAHGDSPPQLEFDDSRLRIHGLEVDTIEACSRPLEAKEFHSKKAHGHTKLLTIEYLWHDICQKAQFNLDDKYTDDQQAFFAYMQTLSNGCVQISGREGELYHDIPDSRWLEQQAIYLVKALGHSSAVAPELRQIAETAEGKDGSEQWSRSANGASKNRVFARTKKGYYVLGPRVMEAGDIICVLFGGKMPFCLRRWGEHYLLVGECYVHGLMHGEAIDMMDQKKLAAKVFELV